MEFMVLILAGFLLANNILIMSALIPLCLLAFGYFIKTPQDVVINKSISTTRIMVGQHLDVTLKVAVKAGVGHIEVCDIVPANFELVGGSNYIAVWKGPQEKVIDLKYTVRSTVSGTYPIKPTVWKSKHPICNYFVSDECDSDKENFYNSVTIWLDIFSYIKLKLPNSGTYSIFIIKIEDLSFYVA
jgi:hypothetical protein